MHSLLCFSTASCPVVLMTNFTLKCKLFHYCLQALDFETVEPINPLDGLLKKTKYGAEVVVGKSFPMSWLEAWHTWLNFDNGRGTNAAAGPRLSSTKLLNKDAIEGGSMVGVIMMGTDPSW